MKCDRTATMLVLVIGSPIEEFSLGSSLRQGGPISPFLLLLVVGGLNVMLN